MSLAVTSWSELAASASITENTMASSSDTDERLARGALAVLVVAPVRRPVHGAVLGRVAGDQAHALVAVRAYGALRAVGVAQAGQRAEPAGEPVAGGAAVGAVTVPGAAAAHQRAGRPHVV